MMEIKGHEIASVSFPDYAIISWQIDSGLRSMVISTDGAFWEDGDGYCFNRADLSFTDWNSFHVRRFDAQVEDWEYCRYDYDELKDICELDVSEKAVMLRGFGRRTGHWIEFAIIGGTAIIRLT